MMMLPPSQQPPDSQVNNFICVLLTVALLGLTFWVNSLLKQPSVPNSPLITYLTDFS